MSDRAGDDGGRGDDGFGPFGAGGERLATAPGRPPSLRAMQGPGGGDDRLDGFLSSMTFAGGPPSSSQPARSSGFAAGACDCDECGYYTRKSTAHDDQGTPKRQPPVPQYVMDTLQRYKRQRLETMPLRRTQHRKLLARSSVAVGLAVWNWALPVNAEPFIEFGSGHRIVYVQRLSPSSRLQSIGKGIVGSDHEQKARRPLQRWTVGTLHFVPSNGGKAVGFVHVPAEPAQAAEPTERTADAPNASNPADPNPPEPTYHAVLVIVKIPKDLVEIYSDSSDDGGDEAGADNEQQKGRDTAAMPIGRNEVAVSTTRRDSRPISDLVDDSNWIRQLCRLVKPCLVSQPSIQESSAVTASSGRESVPTEYMQLQGHDAESVVQDLRQATE